MERHFDLLSTLFLLYGALLLVLGLRAFVVAPFSIPSGSMEDTLDVGDRILVTRATDAEELERGDLIVFDASQAFNLEVPDRGLLESVVDALEGLVGQGSPTDYVKRVIAVAGDRVACCDAGRVTLQRAGSAAAVPLVEPYVFEDDSRPFCEAGQGAECPDGAPGILVGQGRLWVMGDNRPNSADSRVHLGDPGGGQVPVEDVVGKVFSVVWPVDHATLLHRPETFEAVDR